MKTNTKKKLNKITIAALGVVMMSGLCVTNANAAPHSRHDYNRQVFSRHGSNSGAVITAGAIGAMAGLTVGVVAANSYPTATVYHHQRPRHVRPYRHHRAHGGSYVKCTRTAHTHYEQCYRVKAPHYYY